MVSLCSDHQHASNNIHFDIEVTLRSRDEVMIHIFRCVSTRGCSVVLLISLSVSSKVIGKKKLPCSKCRHFDLFTPVTSFFTRPKNDLSKIVEIVRCIQCRLPFVSSLSHFLDLRGAVIASPRRY